MSRIAIVVPRLAGGGAEFVAWQWATSLADRGWEVTVLTTHQDGGSPIEAPHGVAIVDSRSSSFTGRVKMLSRRLRALSPDVVLSLMPHWNVLALLATRGQNTRVIISGRNVEASLVGSHGFSLRAEMMLARALYRRADAYVAISHPVASEAISKYGLRPDRTWVVPNPSTAKVQLGDHPRLARLEPASDAPLTLIVPARIVAQKRPMLAIEVGRALQERGYAVRIEFFGTGPLESSVAERAATLGVPVVFRGWVSRWFESPRANAVVLLPSVSEGFGNVLVEAAAVGVPSVASSRALGVADAIVPGITGEFAIDDSPAAFADAVEAAARLPMGEEIDRWIERFSPTRSTDYLELVLDSVLGKAAR